jgi:hypothetical protein
MCLAAGVACADLAGLDEYRAGGRTASTSSASPPQGPYSAPLDAGGRDGGPDAGADARLETGAPSGPCSAERAPGAELARVHLVNRAMYTLYVHGVAPPSLGCEEYMHGFIHRDALIDVDTYPGFVFRFYSLYSLTPVAQITIPANVKDDDQITVP